MGWQRVGIFQQQIGDGNTSRTGLRPESTGTDASAITWFQVEYDRARHLLPLPSGGDAAAVARAPPVGFLPMALHVEMTENPTSHMDIMSLVSTQFHVGGISGRPSPDHSLHLYAIHIPKGRTIAHCVLLHSALVHVHDYSLLAMGLQRRPDALS
jgi:hypothetical protein